MAVVPVGEGAAKLMVAEVIVPDEFGDLCLPWDAHRRVGKRAKAESELRARSGCDALRHGDRCRARWRRGEGRFFNARILPGRHQTREILRIGEEGEDQIDRIREPLFGAVGVAHGWLGYSLWRAKARVS